MKFLSLVFAFVATSQAAFIPGMIPNGPAHMLPGETILEQGPSAFPDLPINLSPMPIMPDLPINLSPMPVLPEVAMPLPALPIEISPMPIVPEVPSILAPALPDFAPPAISFPTVEAAPAPKAATPLVQIILNIKSDMAPESLVDTIGPIVSGITKPIAMLPEEITRPIAIVPGDLTRPVIGAPEGITRPAAFIPNIFYPESERPSLDLIR